MKEMYKGLNIVGSDETGVGDYLTPLVACACFVPKQNIKKLIELGVQDSKNLNDDQIRVVAKRIQSYVLFRTKHLTQSGYNKLNKSFNAHELKMLLHLGAINALEKRIDDIDLVVIDQFSNESSINKYIKKLLSLTFDVQPIKTKLKLTEKAESKFVAVAAASILGRKFLLDLMDKQNRKYQKIFPKGANKIVESFAKKFVREFGKKELENVAKIKFKTTERVLEDD